LDFLKSKDVTWRDWSDEVQDPYGVLNNLPEEFDDPKLTETPLWVHDIEVRSRYIAEEDEISIEKYFLDRGFTLIDHEKLSYRDQLSIVSSCDSYATITGSSVLNSIVCKPDASIYVINLDTNWPMPNHEYTPTIVSNNVYNIFSIENFPNIKFSMEQVINRLNEIGV
jgi:capsular polysaccharide biosynthesis protein